MTKLSDTEIVSWLKLTNVKGLGPRKILKLFSIFGRIKNIVAATDDELLKSGLFNEKKIAEWDKLKKASDENFLKVVDDCKSNNISLLALVEEQYPKKLLNLPYPPYTLFLKGDASLLNSRAISIVGSRSSEENTLTWAFNLAKRLSGSGLTIVSGGALGVDTAAHKGSLEPPAGKTVCVLGAGLLRPFPEENIQLFKEIEKKGLLVSEHLPNFPGSRIALLQRNRITSGLSQALILCASSIQSGAMVQSKLAYEQRVPILCPALELGLQPNEGIRFAMQNYNAKEIKAAEDVLEFLKDESKKYKILPQQTLPAFTASS